MFDLSTVAHMMNTYVCCVLCAIQKFHFHINLSYFQNIFLFAFRYNFLLMLHSQHDCQVNCNRYTFFHCDTKINAMKRHFYTLLLFFSCFSVSQSLLGARIGPTVYTQMLPERYQTTQVEKDRIYLEILSTKADGRVFFSLIYSPRSFLLLFRKSLLV